jgi:adenylosuccinate lyase
LKIIVGELHYLKEYVHFLCTSEDINNLSYSLMLQESKENLISSELRLIVDRLATFAENVFLFINRKKTAFIPMLSRTHG